MFLLDGKKLQEGTSFTDKNGNQYPGNWLNLSTEEEKAAVGITWVPDPAPVDNRFYWDTDLPKAIEDKLEEDGSTTKGLKTQFIAQVKDTANKMLAETDWVVIRKIERAVDIPADVEAIRGKIVAEANRLEDAIKAVTTVEELIEVLNNQKWSD